MTPSGISVLRNWGGRAGALFSVLFLLSLFDALIAQFREPTVSVSCTPGQAVQVTGPLPEQTSLGELTYHASSKDLRLAFDSPNRGYWLGGRGWRGKILVDRGARPGTYEILATSRKGGKGGFAYGFQVRVFQDKSALSAASASYTRRFLNVSPWVGVGALFPLVALAFGGVFLLSDKAGRLLKKEGKAEVYRVSRRAQGYLIYFDMGWDQGVRPGDRLALFGNKRGSLGRACVLLTFKDYSIAETPPETLVKPGWVVSRFD